jgi:hypothetical protein
MFADSVSVNPNLLISLVSRFGTVYVAKVLSVLNSGKSKTEVARALGIHPSGLSRLARGLFRVKYELHPDLKDIYDVLQEIENEEKRRNGIILRLPDRTNQEGAG